MPFKSQAQRGFMYSQHPKLAKEFEKATPKGAKLPEHVQKMADGGLPEPQDIDQEGLQTPPEVLAALGALAGGSAMAEDVPEMLGNETGSISLGGNAPEMEGTTPKIEAYVKGIQKGGSSPVKIWGVKGDPAEIEKLGFGSDPASIPEHILRQHGILPDTVIDASDQNAPNGFADGGEVASPTLGSENPILAKLKALLSSKPIMSDQTNTMTADNIDPVVDTSTPTPKMADGGDISAALQQLISPLTPLAAPAQAAQSMAANPSIQQALGQMLGQSAPPPAPVAPQPPQPPMQIGPVPPGGPTQGPSLTTPPGASPPASQPAPQAAPAPAQPTPDIYQGINAQDRANQAKQLLANQAAPANLAASGAAGLGDAIVNSFGRGGANFQQNMAAKQAANREAQIGITDTQRGQTMQDLQAKLAVQENDPASPYSKGMRQFYSQLTGKQFPSGISASMMKSAFPDYAKIFDSQLTAATARAGQKVEAQKAGAAESPWKRMLDSIMGNNPAEAALQNTATGGNASTSSGTKMTTPSGLSYTVNK